MTPPSVSLKDVTTKIGSGSTPTGGDSAYKASGIPLVRSMNIHDGAFIEKGLAYLDEQQADALKNVRLHAGDVLINITGASVARVCRLPNELDGGRVNQHVAILRPRPEVLDAAYLEHLLRSPASKSALLNTAGAGATREAITKAQLEQFHIPLPSLDEQRRIAAIMDTADALRQKRKRAIALLDSLTQSIFLEMFDTDQGDWATLGDITDQITDGAHFTPTYVDVGVPFLRVTDIQESSIDWATVKRIPAEEHEELIRRCRPEHGDILLSKNGTIGIPRLVDWSVDFSLFVSLALIKPKRAILRPEYLLSFLRSPIAQTQLRQHAKTGTVTNLHLVEIRKLRLPLPSLAQQAKWCEAYDALQAQTRQLQAASLAIESFFSSLQHRAFSGQL